MTANVLKRVLLLKVGGSTGSSFTLDRDGRQYLVTAKHVLGGLTGPITVEIYGNDTWERVPVRILDCGTNVDIAVLVPERQLTDSLPLESGSNGAFVGQDAYFVGFPYGLKIEGTTANGTYPLPFVKKALISAFDFTNPVKKIYLDGHNNPGFSGAPIVFRDMEQPGFVFKVAGVVSGFMSETVTVTIAGSSTEIPINTGIIDGVDIQYALDAMSKDPTGPLVTR
jgi:hypothetical protein